MKQEYLHDHGNYGEAYFVPQEHLNNINKSLKNHSQIVEQL